jgi:hypothetical protein
LPFLTIILFSLVLSPSLLFAQEPSLPAIWTTVNIGSPLLGGGSRPLPCRPTSCPAIAIQTSAAGWASTDEQRADELTFVYKSLIDDFAVIARIEPPASGIAAAGGLSVRAGLEPSAAAVSLVVSASGQLLLHNRTAAGDVNQSWLLGTTAGSSWLKLERRGTVIAAFQSSDGTQWTYIGHGTIPETRTVDAGMVAASANPDALPNVLATGFRIDRLSTLPAGWNGVEVGAPWGSTGAFSYLDGAYTTFNSSGSIGDLLDRFGFTYIRVTGDAEIVARVLAPGTPGGSEAGVMARESLDPDAAHVFAAVAAPSTGITKRRIAAGLPTSPGATRTVSPGWWLKLVRRGPLVTTFESAHGAGWTPSSSDIVPLPDTFFLGLAFASGFGLTAQGVFDQVSVRALAANQSPLVTLDTPATTVTAGDAVAFSASASDPDDRVEAVEFYVDGTPVGTDTATPFQATWVEALEGTHVLTAVAIDSEKARTTSVPVTVTVSARATSTDSGSLETTTTPEPSGLPEPADNPSPTEATSPSPATPSPATTPESVVPEPTPVIPPISIPETSPPVVPPPTPPVEPSPATSWQLQFAPSPDHDLNVDRYVLQVFTADLVSLAIELDLGHPTVSNGVCAVDVSDTVAALAAGSYVFSVRARDDDTGLFSSPATTIFTN